MKLSCAYIMCIDHLTGRWKVTVCSYVLQNENVTYTFVQCCVICLIFISKWDPFRNKSYQREAILKINRYLFFFFFLKMSSEHYPLVWVHVQCSLFLVLIETNKQTKTNKKKKKKKEIPGFEPTTIFMFPRYTLSPVGHRGVLFHCEEEPFGISLLNLCDKTWSNVNKSSRFTVKIWWFFAHSLHF